MHTADSGGSSSLSKLKRLIQEADASLKNLLLPAAPQTPKEFISVTQPEGDAHAGQIQSQPKRMIAELAARGQQIYIESFGLSADAITDIQYQTYARIFRILPLVKAIADEFETAEVEVHPIIELPTFLPLDIFVKFPQSRKFCLIAVWSFEDGKIIYNERKEALFRRVSKGGLEKWEPDPLEQMNSQEYWLRKNKKELFGASSKSSRRPVLKILATTTEIADHKDHMYQTINDKKYLFIQRKGTYVVLPREEVVDFIKTWLATE